jgi:signal transduction histidine kinase
LASELSLVEERERRRIAGGLHDYVCQNLVLSKIKLQGLSESSARAGAEEIAHVCDTLDQTIEQVRELTFDLSTPTLYKFGLEAALKELLEEKLQAQHGIDCTFHDDGVAKPLAEDVRVLLFQSVRELTVNIIKHAQAHAVTVNIARLNGSVQITVTDDGIGFDVTDVLENPSGGRGFGLFNIKERLDFIGGSLAVDSQRGRGSRFTLRAHLETAAHPGPQSDDPHEGSAN